MREIIDNIERAREVKKKETEELSRVTSMSQIVLELQEVTTVS